MTARTVAQPDEVFEGRITFVGEVLDPRTRRLPVRASIDDPQGLLRPGEVTSFEVEVGDPRELAVLPERSVQDRMGRTQVFVVSDDVAHARDVVVGEVREGRAEILSGLRPGERVVVAGAERVVADRPVRVVTTVADGDHEGS